MKIKEDTIKKIGKLHGMEGTNETFQIFSESVINEMNNYIDNSVPTVSITYSSAYVDKETNKRVQIAFKTIFFLDVELYHHECYVLPEYRISTENYVSNLIKKSILDDIERYGEYEDLDFDIIVEPSSI